MKKIEIINALSKMPEEKTRAFELELTSYVLLQNDKLFSTILIDIMNHESEPISYTAFYALQILYRHKKDYYKLLGLVEENKYKFRKHITFKHVHALSLIESDAFYDYDAILTDTYHDSLVFQDNAGFVHLFPDIFATIIEKDGVHDKEEFLEEWYDLALDAVERAIKLDSEYAKYYCTKARILAVRGNYSQAIHDVNKAIGLEKSDRSDYALRISYYQLYKNRFLTDKKLDALESKLNSILELLNVNSSCDYGFDTETHISKLNKDINKDSSFVFISYSHKNDKELYDIIAMLEKNNISYWYDGFIPYSEDYDYYISEKISQCSMVLFLFSEDAIVSEYVRKEINCTIDEKKPYFFVYLDDIELTRGQRMKFGHKHRFELRKKSLEPIDFEKKMIDYCVNQI